MKVILFFVLFAIIPYYLFSRIFSSQSSAAKVADIRSNPVRFTFVVPAPAFGPYQFILGLTTEASPAPETITGRITLRQEGKAVLEFPFTAANAAPSDGLRSHGLRGYLITGVPTKEDRPYKGMPLRDGQAYDAVVLFSSPPPQAASIWFRWTARGLNKGRGIRVNDRDSSAFSYQEN